MPALPAKPLYVLIEKIAAAHEHVPREWAVHGTTGYRFANVVNGVLIDQQAKMRLDRVWRAFVRGEAQEFEAIAHLSRHLVMRDALAGEFGPVLATALLRLARADRRTRDFTYSLLQRTLAEVIASFPVYRTYIVNTPSAQDCRFIDWAIGRARRLAAPPTPAPSTSCSACCSASPCPRLQTGSASAIAPSRIGCSNTPRRWPPRASRILRSTATTG